MAQSQIDGFKWFQTNDGDSVLTVTQVLDYYVKEYLKHGIHPTRKFSLSPLESHD